MGQAGSENSWLLKPQIYVRCGKGIQVHFNLSQQYITDSTSVFLIMRPPKDKGWAKVISGEEQDEVAQ
jgi:hypothetical protein